MNQYYRGKRMDFNLFFYVYINLVLIYCSMVSGNTSVNVGYNINRLPNITCIAELRSEMTMGDQTAIYTLGVCWLQDEYAFPIDNTILEKFKEVPFSRLCVEYEF